MRRIVTGGLILLAAVLVWRPASAEGGAVGAGIEAFADVYGGASFTQSRRMTVERLFASEFATRKVSYEGNFVIGARVGAWFDYFGFSFDFSFFQVDGDFADSDVFSNSLLVMARVPLLRSDEYPYGQIQPYFMVGPAFFFADTHADFRPDVSVPVGAFSFDDVGIDLRAGMRYLFPNGLGFFTEYRFTWFRLHADDDPGYGYSGTEFIDTTLATHQIIGGFSIRF